MFETLTPGQRAEYAYRDLGEILTADILTIDTVEASVSGGREVEYGVAIATGKETWLIGPERNLFHAAVKRSFRDWEAALNYLQENV